MYQQGSEEKHQIYGQDHSYYIVSRLVTKLLYGVEADFTREGGAIPETITLQKAKEGLVIVSMEACNHGAYFQNERIKNIKPSFMKA